MIQLVFFAFFIWPFVCRFLFSKYPVDKAVFLSVMLGSLFLPATSIALPIPLFSEMSKSYVISLSLLFGQLGNGNVKRMKLKLSGLDFFMISACTVGPFMTSMTNGLGIVDAISTVVEMSLVWGSIYWAGRRLLYREEFLEEACRLIVLGGMMYAPLCLWEVRMSPQLSVHIYGFFAHSFLQHFRYGGYRPIVFMDHGLMVAFWVSAASVASFWLWRTNRKTKIFRIPIIYICALLCITVVMCKSAGGITFMILGIGAYFIYSKKKRRFHIRAIFLIIPFYILFRIFNVVSVSQLEEFSLNIFDEERVSSLVYRLTAEDMYGARALERPLFGWGAWDRNRPYDPLTGLRTAQAIDSLFLITFSRFGFWGLFSLYIAMLAGSWRCLNEKPIKIKYEKNVFKLILALLVVMFMMDSLLNSMINQVFLMLAGMMIGQTDKNKGSK